MPHAPPGMNQVHLGGGSSATEANELALTVALNHYAKEHNHTDMRTLSVLGFDNSYHGNSNLTLSCSSQDASPSLPRMPWAKAAFP